MGKIKSEGLFLPDGNIYEFTPPAPTPTERGGIIADAKTDEDNIEVKIGEDGKGYVAGGKTGITEEEADAKYALKEDTVITGSFSQNRKAGTIVGKYSQAWGKNTTASGQGSHAEGENTTASGQSSHAEGCDTVASDFYAHAEGNRATASKTASHAEGSDTEASARNAHAEGSSTIASGIASHAEGDRATASGDYSHAEGTQTTASGEYSHAEGKWAEATGEASHAEGQLTAANGMYSHAEGQYTIASAENQHVQGIANIEDKEGKYAHIVGGGTNMSYRKNIHTLDWEGNAEYSGDVVAKGCGGESSISLCALNDKVVSLEEFIESIKDGNNIAY